MGYGMFDLEGSLETILSISLIFREKWAPHTVKYLPQSTHQIGTLAGIRTQSFEAPFNALWKNPETFQFLILLMEV